MGKKNATKKHAEKNGGGDASHNKKQEPPAKSAPVNKPMKNPPASKPVKSGSNSGLWMMMLIVSIGCGVGFYYFFEEMKLENKLLVVQLNSLKNEIGSLSKVNSQLPSVTEAIKSIPEITQSLSSLKSELSKELHKSVTTAKTSLLEVEEAVTSLKEGQQRLQKEIDDLSTRSTNSKQLTSEIEQKLTDSLDNALGPVKDALAVAETNIEGLSNDINRVSSSSRSETDKMSTFQESLSSVQLAISKAESKLKQNTETVNSKFTNYENDARKFEEGLSEKISLLEKKTSQQMKDMMVHVTESKQLSESLQTTSDELKAGMKFEISDGLKRIKTEVEDNKQSLGNILSSVRNLELQLAKLESADNANDMAGLGEELQQMHSEMKQSATAVRNLEDFSKESKQRLERELSTLTSNLRAVKDFVSTVADDVTALTGTVSNIKKTVDVEKESSEKLAAKIDLDQQAGVDSGKSPKN